MTSEREKMGWTAADVRKVVADGPAVRSFVTTKLPYIAEERIFVMNCELADGDENVNVTEVSDS